MEVIVPIHEASEAPFFMSKLRARIMQNSAEKCNDKKKLTKVASQEVKLRSRVKGKLRTAASRAVTGRKTKGN